MALGRFFKRLFTSDATGEPAVNEGNPPASPSPPGPPAIPHFSFDETDESLPTASRERLVTVRALIEDIGPRAANQPVWSPVLVEMGQMCEQHLPKMIRSYREIPPQHRAEIFRKTGRSASYALNDGLDKMIQRLRDISLHLAQDDINSFTANLDFIDRRYGDDNTPF